MKRLEAESIGSKETGREDRKKQNKSHRKRNGTEEEENMRQMQRKAVIWIGRLAMFFWAVAGDEYDSPCTI